MDCIVFFDTQQPRNPEWNPCNPVAQSKNHLQPLFGVLRPRSRAAPWLGLAFIVPGLNPRRDLCQMSPVALPRRPSASLSISRRVWWEAIKIIFTISAGRRRRISTSLPLLSEGQIMGWKERWAPQRLGLLMAARGGSAAPAPLLSLHFRVTVTISVSAYK